MLVSVLVDNLASAHQVFAVHDVSAIMPRLWIRSDQIRSDIGTAQRGTAQSGLLQHTKAECSGSKPWEPVDPIWQRSRTQPLGSNMRKVEAVPPDNIVLDAMPFLCQLPECCLDLRFC
mmetsp:Transcript_289/g.584  ORF Transcript_289/g.584 Transcript_289/m.584 type:complete len:118 (-) Transcript_289:29-382(-)